MNYGETVFMDPAGDLFIGTPLFKRMIWETDSNGYAMNIQEQMEPSAWIFSIEDSFITRIFSISIMQDFTDLGPL